MNEYPNTLVIKENKNTINDMKAKAAKKEQFYSKIYKIGKDLSSTSTPILIGSLLSPFDFEGPLIEIVSAVTLGIGLIMKSVGKTGLEESKAILTNGSSTYSKASKLMTEEEEIRLSNLIETIKANKKEKATRQSL